MLNANALCTYLDVKGDLQLSDDSKQSIVERQINTASMLIENYLSRMLGYVFGQVDNIKIPAGIIDPAEQGALTTNTSTVSVQRLVLMLRPVLKVTSIYNQKTIITEADNWFLENPQAGFIFSQYGWFALVIGAMGTARDPLMGSELPDTWVTYTGGYVLPNAVGLTWSSALSVKNGALFQDPAGNWWSADTGDAATGTTGASEPTWPNPSVVPPWERAWASQTVVDSPTLSWRGVLPLPSDIREAAIITACTMWRRRGMDRSIASETGDKTLVRYKEPNAHSGSGGLLPDEVLPLLKKYKFFM